MKTSQNEKPSPKNAKSGTNKRQQTPKSANNLSQKFTQYATKRKKNARTPDMMEKNRKNGKKTKDSGKKSSHIENNIGMVCIYKDCGKKAAGRYTTDLDILGFNYCKKHKGAVSSAILLYILGIDELAKQSLGYESERNTKENTKSRKRHSKGK